MEGAVVLTGWRKAINLVLGTNGGHREGAVGSASCQNSDGLDVEEIIGDVPTPELAAQMADECHRLLGRLGNATLRQVAPWKMEGYTNVEIAGMLWLRHAHRRAEAAFHPRDLVEGLGGAVA